MLLNLLLYALLCLVPAPTEHRITFFWPGEDAWGTAVADQVLMARFDGELPEESWGWPLCAVSPDLLDDWPYGTWLWVEGIGPRRVSDRTAGWVRGVVDVRWPERRMQAYRGRVRVLWRVR